VNPAGADGLFFGNPAFLGVQTLAIVVGVLFSLFGTFIVLRLVRWGTELRVSPDEESMGLDLSQHNERAYS
jgi:Amt family ammonium transporter